MIWRVHISVKKELGLGVMFCCGLHESEESIVSMHQPVAVDDAKGPNASIVRMQLRESLHACRDPDWKFGEPGSYAQSLIVYEV